MTVVGWIKQVLLLLRTTCALSTERVAPLQYSAPASTHVQQLNSCTRKRVLFVARITTRTLSRRSAYKIWDCMQERMCNKPKISWLSWSSNDGGLGWLRTNRCQQAINRWRKWPWAHVKTNAFLHLKKFKMSSVTAWTGCMTVPVVSGLAANCSSSCECPVSGWQRAFECQQNAVVWHICWWPVNSRRPGSLEPWATVLHHSCRV